MRTPEGRVKDAVVKILKQYEDLFYFFPATGGYGKSGVPDIIVCYRGFFIGIECKAEDGSLTPLQGKALYDIRRCGGATFVIFGVAQAPQLLTLLDTLQLRRGFQ